MVDIGMNLQSVYYWTSEHPFIDRFKTSTVWTPLGPQGAMASTVQLDANGYPTALPTGATTVATDIDLDPASAGTDRVYELTWTGTATISVLGTKVLSSAPGKIVFEYDNNDSWSRVDVSGLDPAHPLTGIHVVRQDQVALYDAGAIFNPEFLDKAETWSTLRFKDWNHIDSSTATSWTQQNTLNSASWSTGNGVPIAVEVALANQTHTGMWINVPAQADDAYVRQTLQYVHDHLDPGLTVKVEYSNEVWNWSYDQSRYALTMGDQLWGTDANHDGKIDPNDPAEHVGDGWMQYYGYRSAQVATIAQQVFGDAPQRLETVLETQTAYQGLEQSIFNGVAKAHDGTVGALFNDWAVTTYFGNELDGATAADQAQVLAWARSGSAGVDAAFHEMGFGGGGFSGEGSLATLAKSLAYQGAVARENGMQMVAYEGGAHLTASAYDQSVQQEVSAFFEKLMDDPRMGDLYTKMAHVFEAAGGTELDAYTDTSTPGIYGDWGILSTIYDDGSPRYDALAALAHNANNAEGSGSTGTGTNAGSGNAGSGIAIYGTAGADTLVGHGGSDMLIGGAGNDTYQVTNSTDHVVEASGGGIDTVTTTLSTYTLGDNVENLTHSGATTFAGTGNALDNIIQGGDGANVLSGLDGNDTLVGGTGADYLDGGTGADRMIGGAGNDVYTVDNPGDVVIEQAGGGIDTVRTSLHDYYILPANVENLVYTGTVAFVGAGNALDNLMTGSTTQANTMLGDSGNDTLIGGSGNDNLDGGTGVDRMVGGAGDDKYTVNDSRDVVVEQPDGGLDMVSSSVSYTLPANVEWLSFFGSNYVVGRGNALDNYIVANNAGDALNGMAGNDIVRGGTGNDVLHGGQGDDQLYGGAGNDVLAGDLGDDMIQGGDGNDVIYGGAGRDQLFGGAGADRFVFRLGDFATAPDPSAPIASWADVIGDFSHAERDRIDFAQIDANTNTDADDAFTFIGTSQFTHHAGELRIAAVGSGAYDVMGDVNGDGVADFHLLVNTTTPLVASDFLL